jgi:hypothetical protein
LKPVFFHAHFQFGKKIIRLNGEVSPNSWGRLLRIGQPVMPITQTRFALASPLCRPDTAPNGGATVGGLKHRDTAFTVTLKHLGCGMIEAVSVTRLGHCQPRLHGV